MVPPDRADSEEQRLLDALLGEGLTRAAARAAMESRPDEAEHLRKLERALGEARKEWSALPGWGAEREHALVARVLEQTTRKTPRSWRWPRQAGIAAASMLLITSALLALRAKATTASLEVVELPARERADANVLGAALRPLTMGERLTRARADLATAASAAHGARQEWQPPSESSPIEVRLLEARAHGLRERRWAPWLWEVSVASLHPLALALWCEIELDRYVLGGDRPPAWAQAVNILERSIRRAGPGQEAKLLTHALERATAYGLVGGERVASSRSPGELWTPEWFADLEEAGRVAGLVDTRPWRDWVSWRGRTP